MQDVLFAEYFKTIFAFFELTQNVRSDFWQRKCRNYFIYTLVDALHGFARLCFRNHFHLQNTSVSFL